MSSNNDNSCNRVLDSLNSFRLSCQNFVVFCSLLCAAGTGRKCPFNTGELLTQLERASRSWCHCLQNAIIHCCWCWRPLTLYKSISNLVRVPWVWNFTESMCLHEVRCVQHNVKINQSYTNMCTSWCQQCLIKISSPKVVSVH